MHDLYVLTKKIFANHTMAIYGYPSVAQYVLSLYTSRVLLTFPYISGVSVPAEESQYVYIFTTNKWSEVS